MQTVWQDLRYGIRILLKNPGFTTPAVLVLALGIGVNTTIFSAISAVLLRPLPYENAERLVRIYETNSKGLMGGDRITVSPVNFLTWSTNPRLFEYVAAWTGQFLTLTGTGVPERLNCQRVSGSVFRTFGVKPVLGRTFLPAEERPGHDHVVLLSHNFWQSRLGSDPHVVGRSLTLDDRVHEVVGVMPAGFRLPGEFGTAGGSHLFKPLTFTSDIAANRGEHFLNAVALLKANVTLSEVRAGMDTIARQLEQEFPESNKGWGVRLVPLQEDFVRDVKQALLVLFGAVGFVLLVACANVANLLLARAAGQQREIAIRSALGGSRLRLIQQLMVQSLLLAILGGVFGVFLSLWGTDLLLRVAPTNIPRLHETIVDRQVLGFALLVSCLTGLIFGLAPALQTSKIDLNESLKEIGRSATAGRARNRLRSLLVISEVALSLVLLIGAGLMIRSFWFIQSIDPGYRAENVLAMNIAPPPSKYREPHRRVAFFEQVLQRVESLSGVLSVAVVNNLPLRGSAGGSFTIDGRTQAEFKHRLDAEFRVISPEYFHTVGIPLMQGRPFSIQDTEQTPPVAVLNRTMALRFWPNENPMGKRIRRNAPPRSENPWMTIVGVVGDVRHGGLTRDPFAEVFVPYLQPSSLGNSLPYFPRELVVYSSSDPARLIPALRREVWAVDKDQPISNIRSMEHALADSVSQRRFNMLLLGVFAAVALSLAAVGLYGVLSYSVTLRTHEIGIRMALGADQRDVLKLVVGHGTVLSLVGVAIGLTGAFALTRVMASLLYGVSTTDAKTFVVVSILVTSVALLASYIPARRATRVDPIVALRHE